MTQSIQDATRRAVLCLLQPVVRLLLKAGLGVGEFTALAKVAYIRAAREQFQDNRTRIAVVTGLMRKEVAALIEAGDELPPRKDRGRSRAERVLAGWWEDEDFQDRAGTPALLPFKGARLSFSALCLRHSGETRPRAILDELLRAQAVRKLPDGKLQALSRTHVSIAWDPESITAAGQQLREYADTLVFNLGATHRPRYARRILNSRVDPDYLRVLIRQLEGQADSFLDTAGRALNDPQHTLKSSARPGKASSLGLGIYLIEDSAVPAAVSVPRPSKRGRRE